MSMFRKSLVVGGGGGGGGGVALSIFSFGGEGFAALALKS